ncbi:MAG: 4-carboxy-4-hydroxy-2-oxoadipate aldolase/oxaloacetate decarboxylase [Albidovulum sp.]|nr:4-carboxy-4-hydroxy-2-oxoadipate aldolase/oxaloacetate decarboxylase [Albidovulum sp.]
MAKVKQNIERASPAIADELLAAGVATVHEAQGREGLMSPDIRPAWKGSRAAGSAVTVSLPPGDNWMLHVAVEQCRSGDVLVVSPTSASNAGYFGELLAVSLAARGVRGIVVEAGVRDVDQLENMRFSAWSKCISAQGTAKSELGSINFPIVCGGQLVNPGDIVVADTDGICVVERLEAANVLENASARLSKEAETRAALASGALGLDYYGMRDRLEKKGLRYV